MSSYWNAIGSIGTMVAVLVAAWQIRRYTRQATTDFEDDISREYRELAREIPIDLHLGVNLKDDDFQSAFPRLYQYIDLSNEQVFPHLWEKICATFETYANHAEFETYSKKDKTRLSQALIAEREGLSNKGYEEGGATFFDITPYEYQKEILEKLEADRKIHSRFRNLVVAATGTGKTVVAAFDYKQVCQAHNKGRGQIFEIDNLDILCR